MRNDDPPRSVCVPAGEDRHVLRDRPDMACAAIPLGTAGRDKKLEERTRMGPLFSFTLSDEQLYSAGA